MQTEKLTQPQNEVINLINEILSVTNDIASMPPDMVTPGQAREWLNQLSSYLCRLGSMEAEFEVYFYRRMSDERDKTKSNADAEVRAKGTNEYLAYRKIKNFRQDLYEKIQTVKKLIQEEPMKDSRQPERH